MIAILSISTVGFAQIQKGDVQLGGNAGFLKSDTGNSEQTTFTLAPKAGFFLSDLTSLGFTLAYQNREVNNSNSNLFQIGAYSRFHKMVSEQFYLYLQPSLSFGFGKNDGTNADITTFDIGITPGMTYFLSPKFAVEMNVANLFYRSEKEEVANNEQTNKIYGLNMNLNSIMLGFSYYIK